jgi:hypothetical protein
MQLWGLWDCISGMKNHRLLSIIILLVILALACGQSTPTAPIPTLSASPFELGRTVYGFFPSPPEVSLESIVNLYKQMGQHADVALLQQNIPWKEFVDGPEVESQRITDIHNQYVLAQQNGLGVIFVVDPLNGLNRSQFYELPFGWKASFGNPDVRAAFKNFTLRIVREFKPLYLGLASEINTYADTHPDDFPNYLSLYQEVYDLVKAEAPETQIFVTFQWEEMNNLIPGIAGERQPYEINWEQIETFEPRLDLWVISSYPFVVFPSGADIPADYYAPLLKRTTKPLAVAEGGMPSQPAGTLQGDPQDQVAYLNAIHEQIGERLAFWIYLLLDDFNLDSYAKLMRQQGHGGDVQTLGWFAHVGLCTAAGEAKAGLEVWDEFRESGGK